jgi:sterol desaturase/sphingolipid hydroxylase (fatty acid hydroxylase superfamily)
MSAWLIDYELPVRMVSFAVVFGTLALLELIWAARTNRTSRISRWPPNLALLLFNTLTLRLVAPAGAVTAAIWAQHHRFGLLNLVDWPLLLKSIAALIALDLAIYLQHVLFHKVPLFFRFHQVHHADVDVDITLGTRFHTIEMVLSMVIKFAAVAILGAPPVAVVLFEIVLNATSVFSHANIRFPARADRILRWIIVTPAMHAVHHSIRGPEMNANFGFNFPWWDRIFSTYRPHAEGPLIIGLNEFQSSRNQSLGWMLTLPFRR